VREDYLDQAVIDPPTIMHQRDRRVRDPPNHRQRHRRGPGGDRGPAAAMVAARANVTLSTR